MASDPRSVKVEAGESSSEVRKLLAVQAQALDVPPDVEAPALNTVELSSHAADTKKWGVGASICVCLCVCRGSILKSGSCLQFFSLSVCVSDPHRASL